MGLGFGGIFALDCPCWLHNNGTELHRWEGEGEAELGWHSWFCWSSFTSMSGTANQSNLSSKETHCGIGRSSLISEGAKMEEQGEVYERQPLRSSVKANDLFFFVVVRESFRYEQIMHPVKRQLGEESKVTRWMGGEDVGALAFCR